MYKRNQCSYSIY